MRLLDRQRIYGTRKALHYKHHHIPQHGGASPPIQGNADPNMWLTMELLSSTNTISDFQSLAGALILSFTRCYSTTSSLTSEHLTHKARTCTSTSTPPQPPPQGSAFPWDCWPCWTGTAMCKAFEIP